MVKTFILLAPDAKEDPKLRAAYEPVNLGVHFHTLSIPGIEMFLSNVSK